MSVSKDERYDGLRSEAGEVNLRLYMATLGNSNVKQ